jgi:2-dehydro-3-deoxyphosphogalactonate aldolase
MDNTMNAAERFAALLAQCPLVAILRGLTPADADAAGDALVGAGFRLLEVPLNSPEPLRSIRQLARLNGQAMVGAGTVLSARQVDEVHDAGAQLVVAPNFNPEVVRRAVALGMACAPGVATPTEAFAALEAGATALKLFPAEAIAPAAVKAMRAVLPASALLLPVGGISTGNIAAYKAAGANGAGIGSALYRPGMPVAELPGLARDFVAAWAGTMRA